MATVLMLIFHPVPNVASTVRTQGHREHLPQSSPPGTRISARGAPPVAAGCSAGGVATPPVRRAEEMAPWRPKGEPKGGNCDDVFTLIKYTAVMYLNVFYATRYLRRLGAHGALFDRGGMRYWLGSLFSRFLIISFRFIFSGASTVSS